MAVVEALHFEEARRRVLERVREARLPPETEECPLLEARGRVLGESITADRDYPPLDRSLRDGYALRAADVPGRLRVVGEVRAGQVFPRPVGAGEAVEIMTGAPVPAGADAVLMLEYARRDGGFVITDRAAQPGEFVNPRASEARRGARLLPPGRRIGFAEINLLATVGRARVRVFRKPRVAILSTGDEVAGVEERVEDYQVRNSNSYSLAAQVESAGGLPEILPLARDTHESTLPLILRGLESDLLLISGGVSAGKYDVVEPVLATLGAEFFFDAVLIQPGRPLVFGRARDRFFFGLPGNPASTMVTFEVFARAALELLGGLERVELPFFQARLARPFRHKTGLTRFLPAELSADGSELTPIGWQGSSDSAAMARANVWLVAEEDRESWQAGEPIRVLLKR